MDTEVAVAVIGVSSALLGSAIGGLTTYFSFLAFGVATGDIALEKVKSALELAV